MTGAVEETRYQGSELDDVLDVSAGLIAAGLILLSYLGDSGLLRILLALGFVFFVPGRAIVTNWPRMASWSKLAMPIVLSLAILTLAATVTLWAHVWKPMDLFQAEAWLSEAGLLLGIARRNRHRPKDDKRRSELSARRSTL
jgi:uncharacterized membrane protein